MLTIDLGCIFEIFWLNNKEYYLENYSAIPIGNEMKISEREKNLGNCSEEDGVAKIIIGLISTLIDLSG